MVKKRERYLIDIRFIVQYTHDTFVGAPLLLVDGNDRTFIFGFIRILLHLHYSIGIESMVLVIGKDSRSITLECEIS